MSFPDAFRHLRPLTQFLGRTADTLLMFMDRHYTPLAVLVLIIAGGIVISVTCYLTRYDYWNWWLWKSRAAMRSACLGMALVALKTILGAM